MDHQDSAIDQPRLVTAWEENLPLQLHANDLFKVRGDVADPQTLQIYNGYNKLFGKKLQLTQKPRSFQ